QVTALYELTLEREETESLGTVRVRAKEPRGMVAKESELSVPSRVLSRAFASAPSDFRFAAAVMGGSELLRQSPHAKGWNFARVISIIEDTNPSRDPDRAEFLSLMKKAQALSGENASVSRR